MTAVERGRRYRGLDADERATQRRHALLQSALELFGTVGYVSTTVKQLCEHAGLTERYFYESFADREDCLVRLYRSLTRDMTNQVVQAMLAEPDDMVRAGLGTVIRHCTDDRRIARVLFVESVGVSERMDHARHASFDASALLVERFVLNDTRDDVAPETRAMTAAAIVGSAVHLLSLWLLENGELPVNDLIDTVVSLAVSTQERLR